jgi:single-strand DNA-binding protein
MNEIKVIGNVGKDPEIRYSKAGKAVVKFSVADTRGKDDQKQTTWHNVTVFDEQAENVAEQVKKGARVLVVGRLNKESYTDKDGNKREAVEIIADDVCLSLKWRGRTDTRSQSVNLVAEFDAVEEPF